MFWCWPTLQIGTVTGVVIWIWQTLHIDEVPLMPLSKGLLFQLPQASPVSFTVHALILIKISAARKCLCPHFVLASCCISVHLLMIRVYSCCVLPHV